MSTACGSIDFPLAQAWFFKETKGLQTLPSMSVAGFTRPPRLTLWQEASRGRVLEYSRRIAMHCQKKANHIQGNIDLCRHSVLLWLP
ncbi:hypothetical protein FHR87_001559 [Azomonas macrocytogenes]|uniref:Uncharacterized protein n=1 Tax=Azomonas macrocytogenes TaxID=69962 RepID=A0A839T4A6_AZOMA|nr:hypothetical protein [Azomonas macrocytogenes]